MIYLDKLTEEKVLRMLINSGNRSIGNGSSRIVYVCPLEVIEYLEKKFAGHIYFNPTVDYIVKVGIGFAGFNQIELERNTFETYSDTYDIFAEIPCCGKMVEIMEKVLIPCAQCVDYWGPEEFFCEVNDFNYAWYNDAFFEKNGTPLYNIDEIETIAVENGYSIDYSVDFCEGAFDVQYELDNILGETSDNGQIGMNSYGNAVVYDFGFDPNRDRETYVSYSSDEISWAEDKYLEFLVDYLENRISYDNYTNGDVSDLVDDFMVEMEN